MQLHRRASSRAAGASARPQCRGNPSLSSSALGRGCHAQQQSAAQLLPHVAAAACGAGRRSSSRLQAQDSSSSSSSSLVVAEPSLTRRMFEQVAVTAQAGGAGGSTSYQALLAADAAWSNLRNMPEGAAAGPAPEFVKARPRASVSSAASWGAASSASSSSSSSSASKCAYDVVVAGGTLGVFVAVALAMRGWRVAVVERGLLKGRSQEWNISRKELQELVELGLLTSAEAESVIALEFNPVRVGFHGGSDVWTRDVLNLGVRPDKLIALMRGKLEQLGGKVIESAGLAGVEVLRDGVQVALTGATVPGGAPASGAAAGEASSGARVQYTSTITTRLLLDCMGHASPIVKQLRWGRKPDGVCLVVGGCARGFDPEANTTADVIYTNSDMSVPGAAPGAPAPAQGQPQQLQLFWEAFPAADGLLPGGGGSVAAGEWRSDARTTYMFTYMDAQAWRPSLLQLFEDYWRLMPAYQQLPGGLEQLSFQRLLFGFFPTFKQSPLPPGFDRVLQIGDASGIQSPLSFGGFGALTRHLGRLSVALSDALAADALSARELALVNAYNPGLSSAWMLQRAMTGSRSQQGRAPAPNLINKMLDANFHAMTGMGDEVLKPFLQDVIQFNPLARTMAAQMVADPGFVPQLVAHVGPAALADWLLHVGALGGYSALHAAAAPPLRALAAAKLLPPKADYALKRALDAWQYGSGADFKL